MRNFFNKFKIFFPKKDNNIIFEDRESNLKIFNEDNVIIISGKQWIASFHTDAYKSLESFAVQNDITIFDLSQCNITSRLISNLENIYVLLKKPLTLKIDSNQQVLLNYLISKYPILIELV